MISTVTTATVSTVTTVALAGSLGLIAIITLLTLLVQKEIASADETQPSRALSRALNIAIVPLLIGFVMIVAVKVTEALK